MELAFLRFLHFDAGPLHQRRAHALGLAVPHLLQPAADAAVVARVDFAHAGLNWAGLEVGMGMEVEVEVEVMGRGDVGRGDVADVG